MRVEHITIYQRPREFAAWPFNHGFSAFAGDELVVGFCRAPCSYAPDEPMQHEVLDIQRGEYVFLRSRDGGQSWPESDLISVGFRRDIEARLLAAGGGVPRPQAANWQAPDFMLSAGFGLPPKLSPVCGYIQFSEDRGRSWCGPFRIPSFGFKFIQVKPDFLVRPDGVILLFVTVSLADGSPGTRFVAIYASPDRGQSWQYFSAIQPRNPDAHFVNRYYASPVWLPDGRILVALRCQVDACNAWPEVFVSGDGGYTWAFHSRPADWGGPSHLLRLRDGRLLITYARRARPYGIRARVSEDGGAHWGFERVLREDGGSWDLGYPRTAELSDGRVMTAYYFNRADDPIQQDGGVRHIAGSIFSP